MEKYKVGTKLFHRAADVMGVVIPNFKLPGDVCVEWETGLVCSYDPENLDENCEIIDRDSINNDI